MRSRNYFFIFIVILSLILISIPTVYAGTVIRYEEMPIIIILSILVPVLINVLIEFGVVFSYLRNPLLVKKELLKSVGLVNLVLSPPIQTIVYFFMIFNIKSYVIYIIPLGIFMILVEWILYRLEFQKLHNKNLISGPPSLKKTILISSIANIVSFCVLNLHQILILTYEIIRYPELYSSSIVYIIRMALFS